MKWPVVGPVAGSIYDQDPDLLVKFDQIFNERNKIKAEEQKRADKKANGGRTGGGLKRPARRRG